MNKTLITIALTTTLLILNAAWADEAPDPAHGKMLHNKNCIACHSSMTGGDGTMLYKRPNRHVKTHAQLESQVRRCESNLQIKWFDSEILDVAAYLDKQFYKLKK